MHRSRPFWKCVGGLWGSLVLLISPSPRWVSLLLKSSCLLFSLIPVLELFSRSQNKDICPIKIFSYLHMALFSHILFFSYSCSCQQSLVGSMSIWLLYWGIHINPLSSELLHCALVLMKWGWGRVNQDRWGKSGFKIWFFSHALLWFGNK